MFLMASVLATSATVLADATAADPFGGYGVFVNLGVVGVLIVMIVTKTGFIPKWTLDEVKESNQRELEAKDQVIEGLRQDIAELKVTNSELQKLTGDKLIPALVQATDVSRAYVSELSRRRGRENE